MYHILAVHLNLSKNEDVEARKAVNILKCRTFALPFPETFLTSLPIKPSNGSSVVILVAPALHHNTCYHATINVAHRAGWIWGLIWARDGNPMKIPAGQGRILEVPAPCKL